jgi:hypothetical protein
LFDYVKPKDGPVVEGLEEYENVFARHQRQYIPLRTLRSNTLERQTLSRWSPTPEQRAAIANGADIFLELATFGGPLQPIRVAISDKPGAVYFHEVYQLRAHDVPDSEPGGALNNACNEQGVYSPESWPGSSDMAAARMAAEEKAKAEFRPFPRPRVR